MKPPTNKQIRKWLPPKRAERVIARIDAAGKRERVWKEDADRWREEAEAAQLTIGEIRAIVDDAWSPEHPDEYLPPGLDAPVLLFPITDRPKFAARRDGDDIIIAWSPDLDWEGKLGDLGQGEKYYFGNSGMIYHASSAWREVSTEWMRNGREDDGTYYPYEEKFEDETPTPGMPIGIFVASLWRAGWTSKRERRTWVQWFDPETWERIEVPNFTVPKQIELPPVEHDWDADYDAVNSPEFLGRVDESAISARVKLRHRPMNPDPNDDSEVRAGLIHPTRIWFDATTLRGTHHGNSGWVPKKVGMWAWAYFTMADGTTLAIKGFTRHDRDTKFEIRGFWEVVKYKFGYLPEPGDLCAIWWGSIDGDIRVDFYPLRYGG